MKKGLTEIVFVLDRSGSMAGKEEDTIGGFNSFVEKQRQAEGEAILSAVLFDHESIVLYDRIPLEKVEPMNEKAYSPRGSTALLDAVGGAVHHIGNVHKYARDEDVPEHTVFVIITDGMENASCEYSGDRVRKMLTRQQEKYGWEFLYLGADLSSVEAARHMGIRADRSARYADCSEGRMINYQVLEETVNSFRKSGCIDACWSAPIRECAEKKSRK